MSDARPFLNAPKVPRLTEWLGDGLKAEGFEEFVAATLTAQEVIDDPIEQSAVRMFRTFLIAAVEIGRIEVESGRKYEDVVVAMARVAGGAVMAAVLPGIRDDSPKLRIAKLLGDDFVSGAKALIKSIEKQS